MISRYRRRQTSLRRTVAAVIAVGMGALTGCTSVGSDSSEPSSSALPAAGSCGVVLALGAHRNTPRPQLSAAMTTALNGAASTHARVDVVEIDGRPRIVHSTVRGSDPKNKAAKEEDEHTFVAGIRTFVAAMSAETAHVDDLAALRVAAGAARAACPHGGTVYFEDSGLQDIGALGFASTDLLSAESNDVVRYLVAHHELPDLSRVTIVLTCMGDTALPQPDLDQASRTKLSSIWTGIMKAAHANASVDPTPCGGSGPQTGPMVSVVRVPVQPPFTAPKSEQGPTVLPNSGDVGFLPDSATFRDPDRARAALTDLARSLGRRTGVQVRLTGTTSSDGGSGPAAEAGRKALSDARAAAVRDLLVSLGVPAARLHIAGVGVHFAGYVNDRDSMGALLPVPAAHNRCVLVTLLAS